MYGVSFLLMISEAKYLQAQALDPGSSLTFVSQASLKGEVQSYGLRKKIEAVKNCRNVGKKDMKYNSTRPKMKVDPEKYVSLPPRQSNFDLTVTA